MPGMPGMLKPNATGFAIGMPGMPNPMQLASRSACRAAKPNATGFTIDMPGMPNPMQLASRSTCPACQTQCNWLHDRHARHAKPKATGFTIDMPGMPNPMQLASRSACPACQTQCNWLHDRHARHAKPEEQIGVLPVTIPETTAGHFSGPVPFSLLKWRMVKYICPKFRFATQTLDGG